jgi:alpha-galactosidase
MKYIAVFIFLLSSRIIPAQKSDFAPTPPMGWNSWNTFGVNISMDPETGVADNRI